jgi:hypothetical protein
MRGFRNEIPTTLHKDFAMRHGHTSRSSLKISAKTVLAFVALVVAAACSDSLNAPTNTVSAKHPAGYDVVLGVKSFRYDPDQGAVQRLGSNVLVIPAAGVCDLSSPYGAEYWDDACEPLTHSIVITATMFADSNGSPYVDFQPALRFVPDKETDLYLKDGYRDGDGVTIDYCNLFGCVDESLTDSSLVTQRLGISRILVRRIKHFSGYTIGAGDCRSTVVPDPDGGWLCQDNADSPRSGYMLATGLDKTPGTDIVPRHRNRDR